MNTWKTRIKRLINYIYIIITNIEEKIANEVLITVKNKKYTKILIFVMFVKQIKIVPINKFKNASNIEIIEAAL